MPKFDHTPSPTFLAPQTSLNLRSSEMATPTLPLGSPAVAVVSGANRGLGLEVGPNAPSVNVPPTELGEPYCRHRHGRAFGPAHLCPSALLPLQLCRQLQQRGWRVVALCRRSSPELEALRQDCQRSSSSHVTVVEGVDVGSDANGAAAAGAGGGERGPAHLQRRHPQHIQHGRPGHSRHPAAGAERLRGDASMAVVVLGL